MTRTPAAAAGRFMPTPQTLADARRWADPAQPVLTFYDDSTGERVEFSARTLANWVAKTANLGTDILDLEAGRPIAVDLPTHWLGTVWVLAAVTAGWPIAVAGSAEAARAEVLVTASPAGVLGSAPARRDGYREVVAVTTRPLALSYGPGLPAGAIDYAAEVAGCADVFVGEPGSIAEAQPWWSQGIASAARLSATDRVLTGVAPTSADGIADVVLGPALATASVVLVAGLDHLTPARIASIAETERSTVRR